MIKLIINEFIKFGKTKILLTQILFIIVTIVLYKLNYTKEIIYSYIPFVSIIISILFSGIINKEIEDGTLRYYLTKPFDTRELLACINALLRRQGNQVDELVYGNTALDLASGTLVCGENSLRLSAREFDVMRLLLQSKGNNLSKEVLLARVWGYDSNAVDNHVEVYVGFLRKKLQAIGSNLRIVSVRRLGYHLEVEDA